MDLYDIFDQESDPNSTCWFDAFWDNENSLADDPVSAELMPNVELDSSSGEISGSVTPDTSSTNITDNKSVSNLGTNLTWSDLTLELLPILETEEDLRQTSSSALQALPNSAVESFNLKSNPVSHIATSESHANTDKDFTRPTSQCNSELIARNIHKRQQFSPYENFQRFLNKDSNRSSKLTTVQKAHSPARHKLLILPNGEVYRKVNFHCIESTEKYSDCTPKENSLLGDFQPASPSGSSDSGLSLNFSTPVSPMVDPLSHPPLDLSLSRATQLPAYTLSEALFADPPLRGGMLILTDEEKNCLATHGHPIPTSLPLNKEQEKYLKKIRRKIKNKIAAQESRRRRKEYTDVLETKMKHYLDENKDLLEKLRHLENYNKKLLSQMKVLSERVRLTHPTKGGACFMVLVLFFALFMGSWDLKSFNIGYGKIFSNPDPQSHFLGGPILGPNLPKLHRMLDDKRQKVLSHGPIIVHPLVENYFDVKDIQQNTDSEDDIDLLHDKTHPTSAISVKGVHTQDSLDHSSLPKESKVNSSMSCQADVRNFSDPDMRCNQRHHD